MHLCSIPGCNRDDTCQISGGWVCYGHFNELQCELADQKLFRWEQRKPAIEQWLLRQRTQRRTGT